MATILIFIFCSAFTSAFAAPSEVRLRLERERSAVEVTGYDLTFSPPSEFAAREASPGFHRAQVTRLGLDRWAIRWDHARTVILRSQSLWVRATQMRSDGHRAPDNLEILSGAHAKLDVIARLDFEDYLLGVLPAEMPSGWPLEALKAQAVAARSYVLREMVERRAQAFDVDSTIRDQAYEFSADDSRSLGRERLRRVLSSTHDEVLVDGSEKVMKAFYSADCGCQSEDPKFVWGKIDALESVKDPTCERRTATRWQVNLQRQEVRAKLLKEFHLPPQTTLRTLQVGGRTPSGRVAEVIAALEIDGRAQNKILSAQDFRRIFGFQRVRSADFSARWLAQEFEISGRGAGHGVGLCQVGARTLAEDGVLYREILKIFYPRARVETLRAT